MSSVSLSALLAVIMPCTALMFAAPPLHVCGEHAPNVAYRARGRLLPSLHTLPATQRQLLCFSYLQSLDSSAGSP
jgi:hypothetical protein